MIVLNTVQEEILAREIFGEIARLKHLANFTLTNDIWMYYNSGCVIPYIFCWRFKYWRKIEQIANRQNKVLANKSSCTVFHSHCWYIAETSEETRIESWICNKQAL